MSGTIFFILFNISHFSSAPHQRSHQRSHHAMEFEVRFQEVIERQERCARGDAWRLTKNDIKLKENDKATFFSPTNEWCLPAPSVIKPEGRREDAHVEQERPELSRIGNRKSL